MTVTEESPETTSRLAAAAAPQGGSAADHRSDPIHRQSRPSPACCTSAMVRSPIAHAKITSIDDAAEAKAAPGVVAVFTGADLADEHGPACRVAGRSRPRTKVPSTTRSRGSEVNFAGEIVAVVVARSAAAARDATELVDVEYEDEQVVLDLEAAAAGRSLRPSRLGARTVSTHWVFDSAEAGTGGDVEDEIDKGSPGRHRDRADLPAAAADPGVHGAALRPRSTRPVTRSSSGHRRRCRTFCASSPQSRQAPLNTRSG